MVNDAVNSSQNLMFYFYPAYANATDSLMSAQVQIDNLATLAVSITPERQAHTLRCMWLITDQTGCGQ